MKKKFFVLEKMRYYYKVTEEDSPVEIALGNPVYSSSPTPDIDKLFTFIDKDGFPVTDRNTNELKAIALPSTREGFSLPGFSGRLIRATLFIVQDQTSGEEYKIGVDLIDFPSIKDVPSFTSLDDVRFLSVIERKLIEKKNFQPKEGYVYEFFMPFQDFIRKIYSLTYSDPLVLLYISKEDSTITEPTGQFSDSAGLFELDSEVYGSSLRNFRGEQPAQAEAVDPEEAEARAQELAAAYEAEALARASSGEEELPIPKLFRDLAKYSQTPYGYYFVDLQGINRSVDSINIVMGKPVFCFKNSKFDRELGNVCMRDQVNLFDEKVKVASSIINDPRLDIVRLQDQGQKVRLLTKYMDAFYTEQNTIMQEIKFSPIFIETVFNLYGIRTHSIRVESLLSNINTDMMDPTKYTMGYLAFREDLTQLSSYGSAFALVQNNDTGYWRAIDSFPYAGLSEEFDWIRGRVFLQELLQRDPWKATLLIKIEYPLELETNIRIALQFGRNLRKTTQFGLELESSLSKSLGQDKESQIRGKTYTFESYVQIFDHNMVFDGEEFRYTSQENTEPNSLRYAKIVLNNKYLSREEEGWVSGTLNRLGSAATTAASNAASQTSRAVTSAVSSAASGAYSAALEGVKGTLSALGALVTPAKPQLTINQLRLEPDSFFPEQKREKALQILSRFIKDGETYRYLERTSTSNPGLFQIQFWDNYSLSGSEEFKRLKTKILDLFDQINNTEIGRTYLSGVYASGLLKSRDIEVDLSKYLWHIKNFHNLVRPDGTHFKIFPLMGGKYVFIPFDENDFNIFLDNVPEDFFNDGPPPGGYFIKRLVDAV